MFEGIPLLLPAELLSRGGSSGTGGSAEHKRTQIAFFDQPSLDDFGVLRPRGAPALHEWLLREKFRRSIVGLEELVAGSTVLVVCGGSGLDAEFLVEAGAHVILSDISLGVLLQARERSQRFDLGLELVVADVEALPFPDESVDLVYVHDGLHHLEQPLVGLAEMARVARHAVSVSEPAAAFVSKIASHLGWAEAVEEAGNPVGRVALDDVVSELRKRGFSTLRPHRYAMVYRHWPGRVTKALSRPGALGLAKGGFALINRVLGRFGNKLAVQAVRAARSGGAGAQPSGGRG